MLGMFSLINNIKSFFILGAVIVGALCLTWIVYTLTSGAAAKVESQYIAASLAENVRVNEREKERYDVLLSRTQGSQ